jgi:glycosyltransferase involved in cell wall biosynthesis
MEAMSRGIPCVVSGVGALPETVGPGGDSIASHKEISSWVAAIRRYSDEKYLSEKSRAALAESKRYSPNQSVEALSSVIQRIALRTPSIGKAP